MDDTNEDSWLYGTSNPDSTTNEVQGDEVKNTASSNENRANAARLSTLKTEAENEAQALAAVQNASSNMMMDAKEEQHDQIEESYGDYEDPAEEMEEDEEAIAAARAADTTEGDVDEDGVAGDESEQQEKQQFKITAGSDDDDEDDSDDDINVVIGDIKSAPSSYNIKQRGNLLAAGQTGQDKSKTAAQGGKFSIEDFEGVGTINGVAAHEFSIDSLEDKPWRKPGADITDYFNYGFNEETWRAYCERQKRFRLNESGVGLASLTQNQVDRHTEHGVGLLPPPGGMLPPTAMMHDPMQGGPPTMMPPPMNPHHHNNQMQRIPMRPRQINNAPNPATIKESPIQVMTAECREYSRPGQMGGSFSGPPPNEEPFFPESDAFDYGYEPTQESQWGNNDNSGWVPTGVKELTPGPALMQQTQMSGPPVGVPPPGPMGMPPVQPMGGPPIGPPIRGPMMNNMPPNMAMGPPPPHVMMMGPGGPGGPMGPMPPMGPRMMPPQHSGPPQMGPNKDHPDDRSRSPSRRNRSRSPHRSRRRSKSPSSRQRRSRSRSKSRKPRISRRSRSNSKSRKTTSSRSTRRSRSRSGSKSRKTSRSQRSPSESKSRSKRSRKSHSRSRSKSPKSSTSSSSSKKRSEKTSDK